MKHKYYDAIVAWANGEKIQVRCSDEFSSIYSETPNKEWRDFYGDCPDWGGIEWEWRVKPNTITKKYRMALVYGDCNSKEIIALDLSSYTLDFPAEREVEGFIRWVGDIAEVEIEV